MAAKKNLPADAGRRSQPLSNLDSGLAFLDGQWFLACHKTHAQQERP
jgi:hypothetical protein